MSNKSKLAEDIFCGLFMLFTVTLLLVGVFREPTPRASVDLPPGYSEADILELAEEIGDQYENDDYRDF
jgi:hypothetical protein